MTRCITAVLIMALVTYLPRMLPLVIFRNELASKKIRTFLNYIPYAVLASMTFPDIFYSTSNPISAVAGSITALILSYLEKSLVVVALASIAVVFFAEYLMAFAF